MRRSSTPALTMVAIVAAAFLVVPLAVLLVNVPVDQLPSVITRQASLEALKVSFVSATISALIAAVFSFPLAWKLSRTNSRFARLLRPLILSPIILPPTVAGIALLTLYGRNGVIGRFLQEVGVVSVPYTSSAVVIAGVFVSMPFVVLILLTALDQMPVDVEEAAAIDGASPSQIFWHIGLPYSAGSIVIGVALGWTRALGEFGATLTFAGSLPGVTRTVPMQVYLDLESTAQGAYVLSGITLVVALAVFYLIRIPWRSAPKNPRQRTSDSPQIP